MSPQLEQGTGEGAGDSFLRAVQFIQDALAREDEAEQLEDYLRLRRQVRTGSLPAHAHVWREKVSEWCHQVVDRAGESRVVAFHAMSLLDRYLALENGDDAASGAPAAEQCQRDRDAYQCAAMTALLLAVQFHGKSRSRGGAPSFGARDLLRAGRGNVTAEDLASTATAMLATLSWRGRAGAIPAPATFVRPLLEMLDRHLTSAAPLGKDVLSSLLNAAMFLAEVSVCDSYFVGKRASVIASAAIKCAIDGCSSVSSSARLSFYRAMKDIVGLNIDSVDVNKAASRLQMVCAQEEQASEPSSVDVIPCDEKEIETSAASTAGPHRRHSRMVSHEDIAVVSDDEVASRKRQINDSSSCESRGKRSRTAVLIED